MSTLDGIADLEYKIGVTDDVICQLLNNDVPVNLTSYTSVVFNINDDTGNSFSVPCTIGNGTYSAANGGVTINFSATELSAEGEYNCEFVASIAGALSIFPNGDEYYILKVYPAIEVST
jgi:hypothetical protein